MSFFHRKGNSDGSFPLLGKHNKNGIYHGTYGRTGILLKMFVIVTNIFEKVPFSFYYQCFSAFLFVNSSPKKT